MSGDNKDSGIKVGESVKSSDKLHKLPETTTGTTQVDGGIGSGAVLPPGYAAQKSAPVKKATLDLDKYNFKYPNRGQCVIINNHHFDYMLTKQKDRDGTNVDASAVESLFVSLGFAVTRYDDLTVTEMSMNLRSVAREDHSNSDCFACVILSHGDEGVVYGKNGTLKLDSIISMFKGFECPTLAGKPKLFFIQACRGRRYDHGTEVDETDSGWKQDGGDETDSASSIRRIPVEADIFIGYSVVPGYFSWRNNFDGSWFIQGLVRVLREHGDTMDLLSMMTIVNKVVAYDFESCTDEEFSSGMKQVPCFVSTLTKQLFFEPK